MKICKKCGHNNPDDARFCIECGEKLEETPTYVPLQRTLVKPNNYTIVSRVLAAISAVFTILDVNVLISVVGLTLSVLSILILAIGFYKDKMKGSLRFSLFLNIYSFIAHFIWLAYHLWIAPGL